MTDLASWLLARIAEDEAAAREDPHPSFDPGPLLWYIDYGDIRISTARVLAECAAKRAIVDDYREAEQLCGRDHNEAGWSAAASALERVVHLLAQPYAGADGWDEAWKVGT